MNHETIAMAVLGLTVFLGILVFGIMPFFLWHLLAMAVLTYLQASGIIVLVGIVVHLVHKCLLDKIINKLEEKGCIERVEAEGYKILQERVDQSKNLLEKFNLPFVICTIVSILMLLIFPVPILPLIVTLAFIADSFGYWNAPQKKPDPVSPAITPGQQEPLNIAEQAVRENVRPDQQAAQASPVNLAMLRRLGSTQ